MSQDVSTMIIPAAGFGRRMHGITKGKSKELLDICGKPAIQYALEEAVAAGIHIVGIVIRRGKEEIKDYIMQDTGLNALRKRLKVHFFYQSQMTGECGAILAAEDIIEGQPFIVHYPDNVVSGQPGQVVGLLQKQYTQLRTDIVSLCAIEDPKHHQSARPIGLEHVSDHVYLINPINPTVEKDNFPYGLRTTGVYIASPAFLQACRELLKRPVSGEIKDMDARCFMMSQGYKIYGINVRTRIMDTGSPEGYYRTRLLQTKGKFFV